MEGNSTNGNITGCADLEGYLEDAFLYCTNNSVYLDIIQYCDSDNNSVEYQHEQILEIIRTHCSMSGILYQYFIPPLFLLCFISIIVNIRVLLAVHWIKRPLSPTLHISLSLAAADVCTSALWGTGLFLNSYMPTVLQTEPMPCPVSLLLEICRLSGIIITVDHLLALSLNHWLGILKPLHYTSWMTPKKVGLSTVALWMVPICLVPTHFYTSMETYDCCDVTFMNEFTFRMLFSSLFFVPLFLMVFCYFHILLMVRKQQRIWAALSRSGSKRSKGLNRNTTQQKKAMEGNVKAIYTTLLILGSCIIGWIPANMLYTLVCKHGCYYDQKKYKNWDPLFQFFVNYICNLFIILKTLANPIIYSSRMMEIKDSIRRMKYAMQRTFRTSRRQTALSSESNLQFANSASMNIGLAAFCKQNGTSTKRSFRFTNVPNTPV